jgi:hypothetical protein
MTVRRAGNAAQQGGEPVGQQKRFHDELMIHVCTVRLSIKFCVQFFIFLESFKTIRLSIID